MLTVFKRDALARERFGRCRMETRFGKELRTEYGDGTATTTTTTTTTVSTPTTTTVNILQTDVIAQYNVLSCVCNGRVPKSKWTVEIDRWWWWRQYDKCASVCQALWTLKTLYNIVNCPHRFTFFSHSIICCLHLYRTERITKHVHMNTLIYGIRFTVSRVP